MGGVIWAMDALQPEGCGSLLYVLYEVLSSTPVAAIQVEHVTWTELAAWLKPYQELALSGVGDAFGWGRPRLRQPSRGCWPEAPTSVADAFLGNLAQEVLKEGRSIAPKST